MPISGTNSGVNPLPTQNSSQPPLVERNENSRTEVKGQEKNNDFATHLNEQSISTEKLIVQSREFDPAAEISQQSVYSPSNGTTAI